MGDKAQRWHALEAQEVVRSLRSGPDGLTADAAAQRLQQDGPNQLQEAPPPSVWDVLLHQFKSPLIYILIVAAGITLVVGDYIDAGVIGAVLLLNATIGFTQERRAERSVRALMQLVSPKAAVVRDGDTKEVDSSELVVGDMVLLESGDRVPADLRLLSATALNIDESLLTGESQPVRKETEPLAERSALADRTNMAFAGCIITSGRGRGIVVATASHTELGKIAEEIREEPTTVTPLQKRMSRFATIIGITVALSAAAALLTGVLLGESLGHMFMVAVAMAVAAVPEGLPVVFTITLAIGVHRMARRNAIVRQLPAVETLGSTTVIGSDKTGTLTQNHMQVTTVLADGRTLELGDAGTQTDESSGLRQALLAGVLSNEASIELSGSELGDHQGDPTEVALLMSAWRCGIDPTQARQAYTALATVPFEPQLGFSSVLCHFDGKLRLFVKGAPERLLQMCDRQQRGTEIQPIDTSVIQARAQSMAERGLRLLAMAHCDVEDEESGKRLAEEPSGLVFAGIQGMYDPPRRGVKEAIAQCKKAGIRVLMITGDHPATARSIATEIGLADTDSPVLTGRDMEDMSGNELRQAVGSTNVFARTAPSDKLRLVRIFQEQGNVVAVTGDGVNDAPALKSADVGVAMGKSGTDVAREAAEIVLADDNFVSIYAAVEQGRITFDNVRKVTFFLVSTGIAIVLTIFAAMVARWPIPFLPAQILWLNLATKGLQDVALAFEPGEPGIGRRAPRPRKEGIISRVLWVRSAVVAAVMTVGTLWLFVRELEVSGSLSQAQTVALSVMVLFQAFHVGNSRSEHESIVAKSLFSNPFLLFATSGAFAMHVAALYLPFMQFVLRVEPIPLDRWLWIAAVALTIVPAVELHKWIGRRRGAV